MLRGIANLPLVCFVGLLMLWVMMYSVFIGWDPADRAQPLCNRLRNG